MIFTDAEAAPVRRCGWVLTYSKFPFTVAAAIASIAPEWWLFLLLVIALYVVLGTFLTPSEIILVTVPVLLPVASAVGVHPIHFGMVCVMASAIGHITPPVGLCLFVGMAISRLPMEKLVRPLLPFHRLGRRREICSRIRYRS